MIERWKEYGEEVLIRASLTTTSVFRGAAPTAARRRYSRKRRNKSSLLITPTNTKECETQGSALLHFFYYLQIKGDERECLFSFFLSQQKINNSLTFLPLLPHLTPRACGQTQTRPTRVQPCEAAPHSWPPSPPISPGPPTILLR